MGKTAQFASLGLRITVAHVDGRLSGVLGLEGLKLSESASTGLIYPGKSSILVRNQPVENGQFRDGRVTDGIGLYVCLMGKATVSFIYVWERSILPDIDK